MTKEGVLAGLSEFKIAGLPIGAVAGGAVVGGVADAMAGLATGFVPQFPSWALKIALAWLVVSQGPRVLPKDMTQVAGLFLTYDAVQEAFNIRRSVANIISGVTGKIVAHSPPAFTGPAGGGRGQAGNDYYGSLGGR